MQLVLCLVIRVYCTASDGETLQLMRLLMSKQRQGRRDYPERNRLLVQHSNRRYSKQKCNTVFRSTRKQDTVFGAAIPEKGGGKNSSGCIWTRLSMSPARHGLLREEADRIRLLVTATGMLTERMMMRRGVQDWRNDGFPGPGASFRWIRWRDSSARVKSPQ